MSRTLIRTIFRCALGSLLLIVFSLSSISAADDKPIRVGGVVAQANRISKVDPVYPSEAKQNGIQGTVRLEITIDKEGHVAQLSVVDGPGELIQSAVDAVRQWVYKPTFLNGEPVSVLTTVDINYTLAQ